MWKDLSLREKRAVIKSYVANGVFDRKDIISDYDSSEESYNTFKKGGDKQTAENQYQMKYDPSLGLVDDLEPAVVVASAPKKRKETRERKSNFSLKDSLSVGPTVFPSGESTNQYVAKPTLTATDIRNQKLMFAINEQNNIIDKAVSDVEFGLVDGDTALETIRRANRDKEFYGMLQQRNNRIAAVNNSTFGRRFDEGGYTSKELREPTDLEAGSVESATNLLANGVKPILPHPALIAGEGVDLRSDDWKKTWNDYLGARFNEKWLNTGSFRENAKAAWNQFYNDHFADVPEELRDGKWIDDDLDKYLSMSIDVMYNTPLGHASISDDVGGAYSHVEDTSYLPNRGVAVAYNGVPDVSTAVHERAHALDNDFAESLYYPRILTFSGIENANNPLRIYLDKSTEQQSRLQALRYKYRLEPGKAVDRDTSNRIYKELSNGEDSSDKAFIDLAKMTEDDFYDYVNGYLAKGGKINTFDGPSGDTTDGTNWMQRGADSGRELGDQVAFGYFMNLEHHSANGRNLFSGKDKNQSTQQLKKVDFDEWYKVEGNRNRPVNIPALEQMQDSLVARGFGLPQRLAILATAAQEMDSNGAASRGVGGNGYLGLSEQRMPTSYLSDTPEGRGKQIHFALEDMLTTHSDNWLDGGSGGPTIMNGKDGFTQFWSSPNVYEATRILNKSYIRPAGRLDAWNNRANVAKAMQKHLK